MAKLEIAEKDDEVCCEKRSVINKYLNNYSIIQALLFMLQGIVSYLMMLVFMTYNTWLCCSIILGGGFGYIFFTHGRMSSEIEEHCN
jgi:copper transporter 1